MDRDLPQKSYGAKLLDFDLICFDKCIKSPGAKLSIKEESCLSNKKSNFL